jgi:hypothetical protein
VRISIGDIKDYVRCPLYYKLKNIDEIPYDRDIDEYFKDYFKLSLYYYYFSLLEKKRKSFDGMMKRWEDLWFARTMVEQFGDDLLKEKSNEAIVAMNAFVKKYGDEPTTPIAVNFQYEAIFEGTENLHVTGDIDLIKVVNDRTRKSETQIVFFSMSKQYPDPFMVKNNIATSVASYAFRSSFKVKEDKIVINNIRCSEDTPTIRTGGDYARAEKAIRNICNGIKYGIF